MNIFSKLAFILCLVGVAAYAESVSPFNQAAASRKPFKDIRDINGENVQTFLKSSAPVMPLKVEPAISAVAKLHSGPAIFLKMGIPANLSDVVRVTDNSPLSSKAEPTKINFNDDLRDAPNPLKAPVVAEIKNPLLQNATNMTNALPPAAWMLGVGLLGMAGISRRKPLPV
jgi:hypothetical protein